MSSSRRVAPCARPALDFSFELRCDRLACGGGHGAVRTAVDHRCFHLTSSPLGLICFQPRSMPLNPSERRRCHSCRSRRRRVGACLHDRVRSRLVLCSLETRERRFETPPCRRACALAPRRARTSARPRAALRERRLRDGAAALARRASITLPPLRTGRSLALDDVFRRRPSRVG